MNGYLKIRNWEKWQSYRSDRGQPPWIKVHRSLLRNSEWAILTDAQKGQLVSMWMLAADRKGEIPSDPEAIRKFGFLESPPDFQVFVDSGFIEPDANVTPERRQDDATVTPPRRHGDASVTPQRRGGQRSSEENSSEERRSEAPRQDPPVFNRSHPGEDQASEGQINMLKLMADEARTGLDDLAQELGYEAITKASVDPIKDRLKEIKQRNRRRKKVEG